MLDNQPKRVVMLLANPFTHDTRVHKQARTLIEWGLEVHIVCIAKSHLPDQEIVDEIHVHRVPVKDESVFRIFQGIVKLGSPEPMRAWLSQSFNGQEILIPERPVQKSAPQDRASKPTPVHAQPSVPEQSHSAVEMDPTLDDLDTVCPLPPIEPIPVAEVGPLETSKMRRLQFFSSLSTRSVQRIQAVEARLLSKDPTSLLSKSSESAFSKPCRVVAHAVLRAQRIVHRALLHPFSVKARVALSSETAHATRVHAALVREHTIATLHARRQAERQTKLRDIEYAKALRKAHTQQVIESKSAHAQQTANQAERYRLDAETQRHIQKQSILQAKRDAIEQMGVYRESLKASKKRIQRRSAWKKRFRFVLRRVPSAVRIIGFNDELARKALTLKPDLILAHDCNTLLAGRMLKEVTGSPLVYDSHELFLERNIGSRRRWLDKLCWWPIERGCIGSTDAVFTVAEGIARHLEAQYSIPEVYLLRNVQPYEPPPEPLPRGVQSLMHQEFGLDSSVRIVMYPGAITLNRGIEYMIDAAGMLDKAVFVVMGYANSEPYMQDILSRAKANGSYNSTIFFKDAVPIDEVGRWVSSASLGVVPTQGVCMSYKFEASNKMFHCLMAGVPLAMSDHPEKRILADRRGVGVLFDETSPESIAECINTTLNDQELMSQMEDNCLQAALELNWEHEVHRYLTIMSGLLPDHDREIPPIQIRTSNKTTAVSNHAPLISVPSRSGSVLVP